MFAWDRVTHSSWYTADGVKDNALRDNEEYTVQHSEEHSFTLLLQQSQLAQNDIEDWYDSV